MEDGVGPRASPFHLNRVKDEVELIRKRPLTLDADAEAMIQDRDREGGAKANLEAEYGSLGIVPRVARVQTAEPQDPEVRRPEIGCQ